MYYHSTIDRTKHGEREGFRAWLRWNSESRVELSWGISSNRIYRLCSITIGRGSRSLQASIYIPFVIGFHVKLGGVLPAGKKREFQLSMHGGALWWSIWSDPWGDERRWSKFRRGSFHFDDYFLGRSVCSTEQLEEKELEIPMPEKPYMATVKLVRYTWKRPQWFAKRMIRAEIDIPGGIPFEGKGENSWDCGIDGTFGMTTGEVRDIPEAVGILVASCLRERVKNGGWGDWNWKKVEPKMEEMKMEEEKTVEPKKLKVNHGTQRSVSLRRVSKTK